MTSPAAAAAAAFAKAFTDRDFRPAAAVLADDVVFRSPVLAEPWRTKPVLERLGPAMVGVLDEPRFTATLSDGDRAVLMFTARRDDHDVEAVQILGLDGNGKVAEMAILIRPLPALQAVARAMGRAVDPELLAGHEAVT